MGNTSIKCPNCGEEVQLNGDLNGTFCQRCGTPVNIPINTESSFMDEESFFKGNTRSGAGAKVGEVTGGIQTELSKTPVRKGFNFCMWICVVLAAFSLFSLFFAKNGSVGAVLIYIDLGFMFAVLARSPKGKNTVFEKFSKTAFVVISLAVALVLGMF